MPEILPQRNFEWEVRGRIATRAPSDEGDPRLEFTAEFLKHHGKLVASSDWRNRISIWEADTLRLRAMLEGHTSSAWSIVMIVTDCCRTTKLARALPPAATVPGRCVRDRLRPSMDRYVP